MMLKIQHIVIKLPANMHLLSDESFAIIIIITKVVIIIKRITRLSIQ